MVEGFEWVVGCVGGVMGGVIYGGVGVVVVGEYFVVGVRSLLYGNEVVDVCVV